MKKRKKTVVIDGARYFAERPRECRNCFFWKNRKTGCILGKENCYFLTEAGKSDQEKKCENCPYAKAHPCVSATCFKDLRKWLRDPQNTTAKDNTREKEGVVYV